MKKNNNLIEEGKNSVAEYLNSNNKIKKLYLQNNLRLEDFTKILNKAKKNNINIKFVDKIFLDNISINKRHQGIIAEIEEFKYVDIDSILNKAKEKKEFPFIIILDEIEDPHNSGAIIRTAEAAGVHGIIIKDKNAYPVNATVFSTNAGAVLYMLFASVNNITNAIKYLKRKNIWIYCADMEGVNMYEQNFDGPVALIIGNEGKGVKRLVKENSDFVVKIPMVGKINSLNASCSNAILLYQVFSYRYKN